MPDMYPLLGANGNIVCAAEQAKHLCGAGVIYYTEEELLTEGEQRYRSMQKHQLSTVSRKSYDDFIDVMDNKEKFGKALKQVKGKGSFENYEEDELRKMIYMGSSLMKALGED